MHSGIFSLIKANKVKTANLINTVQAVLNNKSGGHVLCKMSRMVTIMMLSLNCCSNFNRSNKLIKPF